MRPLSTPTRLATIQAAERTASRWLRSIEPSGWSVSIHRGMIQEAEQTVWSWLSIVRGRSTPTPLGMIRVAERTVTRWAALTRPSAQNTQTHQDTIQAAVAMGASECVDRWETLTR